MDKLPRRNGLLRPFEIIHGIGAFNGDGIDQVENINESFLFAGRVEVSPWGRDITIQESAFEKYATLGLSVAHNNGVQDKQTWLGADVAASYAGFSGAFEYLHVSHEPKTADPKFDGQGLEGVVDDSGLHLVNGRMGELVNQ